MQYKNEIRTWLGAILLIMGLTFLVACSPSPTGKSTASTETVYTIGFVAPLTGDGAVYGLPTQRVTQQAVNDLNAQWAEKNMRLEVIYEDGRCNGKDGLIAAQKLVNVDDVKVIFGGLCSSETLAIAPYTEEREVILFSALSSSPDIKHAGDFVFRNYPSDAAQVGAIAGIIEENGYKTVGLLSENNDYPQAIRRGLIEELPLLGVEIVSDEVVAPEARDIRSEAAKTLNPRPEAVVLIPQTIPMAGIMAKQLFELGMEAQGIGNDVVGLDETLDLHGKEIEGYFIPRSVFSKENDLSFKQMDEMTDCNIGYYCATTYDAVFLIGEALEACGEDTRCIRDFYYSTKNWHGTFSEETSFDAFGEVAANFEVFQVVNGEKIVQ